MVFLLITVQLELRLGLGFGLQLILVLISCSIMTYNGLSYVISIDYKNLMWCTFQVDPDYLYYMLQNSNHGFCIPLA